jgi:hypothetical protein
MLKKKSLIVQKHPLTNFSANKQEQSLQRETLVS